MLSLFVSVAMTVVSPTLQSTPSPTPGVTKPPGGTGNTTPEMFNTIGAAAIAAGVALFTLLLCLVGIVIACICCHHASGRGSISVVQQTTTDLPSLPTSSKEVAILMETIPEPSSFILGHVNESGDDGIKEKEALGGGGKANNGSQTTDGISPENGVATSGITTSTPTNPTTMSTVNEEKDTPANGKKGQAVKKQANAPGRAHRKAPVAGQPNGGGGSMNSKKPASTNQTRRGRRNTNTSLKQNGSPSQPLSPIKASPATTSQLASTNTTGGIRGSTAPVAGQQNGGGGSRNSKKPASTNRTHRGRRNTNTSPKQNGSPSKALPPIKASLAATSQLASTTTTGGIRRSTNTSSNISKPGSRRVK